MREVRDTWKRRLTRIGLATGTVLAVSAATTTRGAAAAAEGDIRGHRAGNTVCNGHGTHVAGTVGGTAHGVAKKVKLIGVGCSTAPAAAATPVSSRASTG